ncbi:MAG: hypothetical protein KDE46_31825, partial [Caldilineaceae bacterium]|nr:hypothetical protein [Caldilineaceae bacterium]
MPANRKKSTQNTAVGPKANRIQTLGEKVAAAKVQVADKAEQDIHHEHANHSTPEVLGSAT